MPRDADVWQSHLPHLVRGSLTANAQIHPPQRLPLDRRPAGRHQCYLAEHNACPKPFVWTQSADAILAKLDRCPVPSV